MRQRLRHSVLLKTEPIYGVRVLRFHLKKGKILNAPSISPCVGRLWHKRLGDKRPIAIARAVRPTASRSIFYRPSREFSRGQYPLSWFVRGADRVAATLTATTDCL